MTVQAFVNPFPTFTGLDGLPLSLGDVYFGMPNQDAQQYPKAVFWDEAMTVPATQPLKTSGGYIVRNGSPANVWSDGSCSVQVLDTNSRQVLYIADWSGTIANVAAAAADAATPYVNAAAASATAASGSATAAAGSATGAATSATNALAAQNATYGNAPIYTGTSRSAAVTTGAAATTTGALFKTRQQFGQATDVWQDNGASASNWIAAQPFGLGETAAQIKAIEGATIESWVTACGAAPDILIDPIDMHTWDGRLIPNSIKLLSIPPSKNLSSVSTGDIYFGQGGQYNRTPRVAGAGGNNTAVEFSFIGVNVNLDFVPVINNVTLDPGTYTVACVGRSKTGSGAQTIQWFETSGSTTQTDNHVEGAYAAKSFTFTVAARAAVSVRLRSTATGSAFQFDRFMIWENDGNANPGWTDDMAGGHCKNKVSARGQFVNNGLFWDVVNSLLSDTNVSLAAEGLPININDITTFAAIKVPSTVVQPNTAPIVSLTAIDGAGSAVAYMMGLGNSSPEGPISDGSVVTTPTPLVTHRLCLKGEEFHVIGSSYSAETVQRGIDGLVYYDIPRSGAAAPLLSSVSHLGICNYQNAATAKGLLGPIAIWLNRGNGGLKPFTSTQVKAIMNKLKKHIVARGGTLASFRDILLSEGDSRNNWNSVDPNGPGWNWQVAGFEFFGAGTPSLKAPQVGWSSSVLGTSSDVQPAADINYVGSSLWSRRAKVLALIQACHELGLRVFFTWMNDINDTVRIPANATQYATDERVLMADYRAALDAGGLGSRFILFTCTPRHTEASFEAGRATLNTLRRNATTYAGTYHALADIAADATLGTYSGTTAPAGYVDNLHFNKAGAAIVASIVKPLIAPYRLY